MDVDGLRFQIASKNNIRAEKVSYMQSIGARGSAMEHLVPEQMFSTETEKAQGISAVKALAIASQQGQKIWTITNDNVNLALSRINLGADAENDIRNAVNAGKIATAHETRINFNGWVGEGYTLIDPNTGAGAYMISGGGNGGVIPGFILGFLTVFMLVPGFFAMPIFVVLPIIMTMLFVISVLIAEYIASTDKGKFSNNVIKGFLGGVAVVGILQFLPKTVLEAFIAIVGAWGAFFDGLTSGG